MSRRLWIPAAVAGFIVWLALLSALAHARCHTHHCWHRVHVRNAEHWLREHRPWVWQWRHLPAVGRRWTRCVTTAESRWHRITAGPHHSYFQWTLRTWFAAGGHGMPEQVTWHHQAVLAWRWHIRAPHGQWPRTGEHGLCGS